jgi:hypothetical protein
MIRVTVDGGRLVVQDLRPSPDSPTARLPQGGLMPEGNYHPPRQPGLESARVEVRPVSALLSGERVVGFAGAYAPDVRDAMQVLADAGAGMRIERVVVEGAICTLHLAGRGPMAFPVSELAYVIVAAQPADPAETRLELDPDAAPPADCEGA